MLKVIYSYIKEEKDCFSHKMQYFTRNLFLSTNKKYNNDCVTGEDLLLKKIIFNNLRNAYPRCSNLFFTSLQPSIHWFFAFKVNYKLVQIFFKKISNHFYPFLEKELERFIGVWTGKFSTKVGKSGKLWENVTILSYF